MPLVLGISVIIAVLCSALILYTLYSQMLKRKMELEFQLAANCESGIQYLLAIKGDKESEIIDLFDEGDDSVRIQAINWGVYEILYSEAFRGNQSVKKAVLAAYQVDSLHQSSLYLSDSKNPLYLAGDAKVEGTVYLPAAGVRAGSVSNSAYTGKRLLNGSKRQSAGMPELRPGLSEHIRNMLNVDPLEWGTIIEQLPDSLNHSFFSESPKILYTDQPIALNSIVYGMIIIVSAQQIIVEGSAKLKNVILIAPEVQLKSGFSGAIQIIASDKIVLNDSVELTYPSSLALVPLEEESKIELNEGVFVSGDILIDRDMTSEREGILIMKPNSVVEGFVHIDGGAEILGKIKGHISCKKFEWNSGSEIFGNHLKDAELSYLKKGSWLTSSGLWESNVRSDLSILR